VKHLIIAPSAAEAEKLIRDCLAFGASRPEAETHGLRFWHATNEPSRLHVGASTLTVAHRGLLTPARIRLRGLRFDSIDIVHSGSRDLVDYMPTLAPLMSIASRITFYREVPPVPTVLLFLQSANVAQ